MAVFQRATKRQAKLRLALAGPSGSGKTFTALTIARTLAEGGRVAVIDSENGSAEKYADLFDFDHATITGAQGFSPENYVALIQDAEAAGYAVIVVDSLSHEWAGQGGILELVDQVASRQGGNKFNAWAVVTPRHDKLVRKIVECSAHIICTMRAKMDHVQEKNERGRTEIRLVGMKPIQRDEFEYEFDVYGLLDQENRLAIRKSRCPELSGVVVDKPDAKVAETLLGWLSGEPPLAVVPTERAEIVDINEHRQASPERSEPLVAQPEPTPQEQTRADAVVGKEDLRSEAIRRYKQLAKIATNRQHEAAERINSVDPNSLTPRVLAASLKKLEEYFPGIPELTAEQARDLGL